MDYVTRQGRLVPSVIIPACACAGASESLARDHKQGPFINAFEIAILTFCLISIPSLALTYFSNSTYSLSSVYSYALHETFRDFSLQCPCTVLAPRETSLLVTAFVGWTCRLVLL